MPKPRIMYSNSVVELLEWVKQLAILEDFDHSHPTIDIAFITPGEWAAEILFPPYTQETKP